MIEAPPALPDGKPSKFVQRLKVIICGQMSSGADPAARQRFSVLLDCLNNENKDLPNTGWQGGRAGHPTCSSVLVAKVVQAIAGIRRHETAKDLESIVAEAERIIGKDYRIVGEPGLGWVADFQDDK
jgi:hypothetical protein